jgi:hypothetical protein
MRWHLGMGIHEDHQDADLDTELSSNA